MKHLKRVGIIIGYALGGIFCLAGAFLFGLLSYLCDSPGEDWTLQRHFSSFLCYIVLLFLAGACAAFKRTLECLWSICCDLLAFGVQFTRCLILRRFAHASPTTRHRIRKGRADIRKAITRFKALCYGALGLSFMLFFVALIPVLPLGWGRWDSMPEVLRHIYGAMFWFALLIVLIFVAGFADETLFTWRDRRRPVLTLVLRTIVNQLVPLALLVLIGVLLVGAARCTFAPESEQRIYRLAILVPSGLALASVSGVFNRVTDGPQSSAAPKRYEEDDEPPTREMIYLKRAIEFVQGVCLVFAIVGCLIALPLGLVRWAEMSELLRVGWAVINAIVSFGVIIAAGIPIMGLVWLWERYKVMTQNQILMMLGQGVLILIGVVITLCLAFAWMILTMVPAISWQPGIVPERELVFFGLWLIIPCSVITVAAYYSVKALWHDVWTFRVIEKNDHKAKTPSMMKGLDQ